MYNQHTREMATTRHRSLVEKGEKKAFVRDKSLWFETLHTKQNPKYQETPIFTNLTEQDSSTSNFQQSY